MIALGINIDHIATLRQARQGIEPEPVLAALLAEQAGADQITVHLREDRRHIQYRDVQLLRSIIQTKLNLEMAPTAEMVTIAKELKPDTVTLVPEKREEITTEGGLNLEKPGLDKIIAELKEAGIEVSLFIEPDVSMIKLGDRLGAQAIEIHTGAYANLKKDDEIKAELQRIQKAAKTIKSSGLRCVAGHGINYKNIYGLLQLELFEEYNIGHSIISRAVFTGIEEAVREMKRILNQ
ncbi:MAG: pyridoxine 5'-phosphate synthase [Candidatus Cloacimonetes bacterium]|nr:pyridoxine 5'-phosphate synthase [Candidatus Cloacimonadota bacterium]